MLGCKCRIVDCEGAGEGDDEGLRWMKDFRGCVSAPFEMQVLFWLGCWKLLVGL